MNRKNKLAFNLLLNPQLTADFHEHEWWNQSGRRETSSAKQNHEILQTSSTKQNHGTLKNLWQNGAMEHSKPTSSKNRLKKVPRTLRRCDPSSWKYSRHLHSNWANERTNLPRFQVTTAVHCAFIDRTTNYHPRSAIFWRSPHVTSSLTSIAPVSDKQDLSCPMRPHHDQHKPRLRVFPFRLTFELQSLLAMHSCLCVHSCQTIYRNFKCLGVI